MCTEADGWATVLRWCYGGITEVMASGRALRAAVLRLLGHAIQLFNDLFFLRGAHQCGRFGWVCNRFAPRQVGIDFGHCLPDNSRNFLIWSCHLIIVAPLLNKRKSPRRKMVLPVKVSVDKVTHLAHTIDITSTGARLVAYQTPLQPGMIISLQRRGKRAEFRVEWIKQLAPNELQAGIELLEAQNNFWGVNLSDDVDAKKEMNTFLSLLSRPSKSII